MNDSTPIFRGCRIKPRVSEIQNSAGQTYPGMRVNPKRVRCQFIVILQDGKNPVDYILIFSRRRG